MPPVFRRCLLLLTVCLVLSACNDDGRTLAPATTLETLPPIVATDELYLLTSLGFVNEGTLPEVYTCDGLDILPPFRFTDVPEGTVELALAIDDVDAAGFIHLLVTGIDPTLPGLNEGVIPDGAVASINSFGFAGYGGPCPPEGTGVHQYFFTLYALPAPSGVTPETPARDAIITLADQSIAIASMTAFYGDE